MSNTSTYLSAEPTATSALTSMSCTPGLYVAIPSAYRPGVFASFALVTCNKTAPMLNARAPYMENLH
jgi:hypothetical protein